MKKFLRTVLFQILVTLHKIVAYMLYEYDNVYRYKRAPVLRRVDGKESNSLNISDVIQHLYDVILKPRYKFYSSRSYVS